MKLWEVAVNQLLDRPDPEHQAIKNALARLNPDKEEDQVEYAEWTQRFYDLHICKKSMFQGKWPRNLQKAFDDMIANSTVYSTM